MSSLNVIGLNPLAYTNIILENPYLIQDYGKQLVKTYKRRRLLFIFWSEC